MISHTFSTRRWCLRAALIATAALASTLTTSVSYVEAQELTINTNRSGSGQREAITRIANEFEAQNPGVTVTINFSDIASYNTSIRNFLVTSPPDIAFWFTSARMRAFSSRGLFEPLDGFFEEYALMEPMAPFIDAVTDNGQLYMMPTTFSTWGFYYNKEVFAEHDITPPETWDELMAAAATLKDANIVPFTIGTRDLWANALWFDFLIKRTAGLDFYMGLMRGEESYTDERVKKAFEIWGEAINLGYFQENASSYGWQEVVPLLSQGQAGMYLLGPFVLTSLPDDERDNIGFFPFPQIDSSIGTFEQVSVDGVGIPAGATNKDLARKFLGFLAKPENLDAYAKGGQVVPARTDIEMDESDFAFVQMELVRSADGSSQFFDRDTDPDMAQEGMRGFQEFLAYPDRVDDILERLDGTRQRIFN